MSSGAIAKQKYTDCTLLEPTEVAYLKPLQSLSKWTPFSSPEPLSLICNRPARDQEMTGSGDENEWTPKRTTAMSMSERNVRWPALCSVLGPILPILSCFLSLRSFYFYASTDWDQSGNYRQLLVFSAILITKNWKQWQPRALNRRFINAMRASI